MGDQVQKVECIMISHSHVRFCTGTPLFPCFGVLFVSGDQKVPRRLKCGKFFFLKEVNLWVNVNLSVCWIYRLMPPSIRHCVIVMEHLSCRFCPNNHVEIHLVTSATTNTTISAMQAMLIILQLVNSNQLYTVLREVSLHSVVTCDSLSSLIFYVSEKSAAL